MKCAFFSLLVAAMAATTSAFAATPPAVVILTPAAPDTPRINGPSIFGVRPGSPFLYAIPATGKRPLTFAVEGLPAGLKLDAETGEITGSLATAGAVTVTLHATNALGTADKKFRIVVGDQIALTPPMGWNSWNSYGPLVDQQKVAEVAQAMVTRGLKDHGWSYVNIDDTWQGVRGGKYNAIQTNSKFSDLQQLGAQIHALGLKFGIYSTPWRGSYEGHIGSSADHEDGTYDWIKSGDHSANFRVGRDEAQVKEKRRSNWQLGRYSFAEADARQWADWGVDYLKYDWFPNDVKSVEDMTKALRGTGRDIVYSLSNTAIYDTASDYARLANLWRTTGDIRDTWASISWNGFSQDRWAAYAGPGHWNDPDMLVVGQVGGWAAKLHATGLTPDEQYTHLSLWCLLSAPLLIGCDVAKMDDFTYGLLTNDEVLAIDQDALGKQATQIFNKDSKVIYAKTLEDGSVAVGLFNRGEQETKIAVTWGPWGNFPTSDADNRTVRDLWRQKDLGIFKGKFEATVAPHGVVLVRLITKK
ncbi:MAG: putative Ig domain-containing protein [Chthoniobacteraceae bacterium]